MGVGIPCPHGICRQCFRYEDSGNRKSAKDFNGFKASRASASCQEHAIRTVTGADDPQNADEMRTGRVEKARSSESNARLLGRAPGVRLRCIENHTPFDQNAQAECARAARAKRARNFFRAYFQIGLPLPGRPSRCHFSVTRRTTSSSMRI